MEEVPGDEEGVVAEVNQEGAKEEELQVKRCFSYLHEHLNWTLTPEVLSLHLIPRTVPINWETLGKALWNGT